MTDVPAPLVPAEVDLQDFPFMPLHVARLRDSDFAAEEDPEACWYAVLLWASSWHQLPAASLPDNDAVLCKLIGLGRDLRTFRKHRAGMLRGWQKCSDGRLYHPVVAEQALEAWQSKVEQRHRSECARIKKHNQRNNLDAKTPTLAEFVAEHFASSVPYLSLGTPANVPGDTPPMSPGTNGDVPGENGSKRQGQGQGQGLIEEPDGSLVGSPPTNGSSDLFNGSGDHAGDPPNPPPPEFKPEHVVEAWNKLADECGLPRIAKLSDQRRKQLKARMREHTLDDFATALDAIRRSQFLRDGNGTWRGANFDFFLQPSSFLKLIEGHYDQPAN